MGGGDEVRHGCRTTLSNTFKAQHPVPTERTTQIIWERHPRSTTY